MKDDRLNAALQLFQGAMFLRLEEKEQKGFTGWDDPQKVSDEELVDRIFDKTDSARSSEKNCIDMACLALMLWYRQFMRTL